MNIGIVGLGLMGGSMAKSVKFKTGHSVFAIDIDKETMMLANLCGAMDGELSCDTIKECEVIFLALRPKYAEDWLCENGKYISSETVVVDFCGVKKLLAERLEKLAEEYGFCYVGGHPMAGKERGGFKNSTEDLFVGASMILTPDANTTPETLETLRALFYDVGFSRIEYTTPEEHDRIIAYTSQLAHIVSSAYVKSDSATKQRGFSAGSFRDMTRVAYLDEEMWTELFLDNRENLLREIDVLLSNLQDYKDALEEGSSEKLKKLLKEGKECKIKAGGN